MELTQNVHGSLIIIIIVIIICLKYLTMTGVRLIIYSFYFVVVAVKYVSRKGNP